MAAGDAGDAMEMGEIDVIAGIGCRTGVAASDIIAAVDGALAAHALDRSRLRSLAIVPRKSREPAIHEAAMALGVAVDLPSTTALDDADRRTVTRSGISREVSGYGSASEAAALAAAGPGGRLLGPRFVSGGVTCALAVAEETR